ncbi:MAG: glycosyltransferase family 2 protein [Candidatus Riflebacteria bacterium]|nr:glycosyltransferase family 2 protein [Candidatus Riflebacteria bacterium]
MSDQIAVSVCIPVFNEVDNLEELVHRVETVMARLRIPWELILVDDGSRDGSYERMRQLGASRPFLRGIRFDRNHGQTAAMAAGIRASRGEAVVTMDADLQNDPEDIPRLLEGLAGHAAVVGWRARRQDTFVRRVSSRFANWFRNLVSDENIRDTGCSLKAFRGPVVRALPFYEGMHRFLPTLVKMGGGTVAEIEVAHHPRTKGTSKYNVWNRVFRSFLDLLAIRWMKWRQLRYRIHDEF